MVTFEIQFDLEDDGRVIASVDALPGCMAYGRDRDEARRKVVALALAVVSDQIAHGEWAGGPLPTVSFAEAA